MKARSYLLGMLLSITSSQLSAIDKLAMIVGTYTDTDSKGLYSFSFDQSTGLATLEHTHKLSNPSYLTFSLNGKTVYAVNENNDSTAAVTALQFNPNDGQFTIIDHQVTNGKAPCYIATNGEIVLTANYSSGTLSLFPILSNGGLGEAEVISASTASGPDQQRQSSPHTHCILFTPDNFVLSTDFSGDRILIFHYNPSDHTLTPTGNSTPVAPDSGPRHLTMSNNGRYIYLMSELSGKVTVYSYEAGHLKALQSILADDAYARGGADIHLSPDGRYLYASSRLKEDGITIFKVLKDGTLQLVERQLTGRHPRNFAITPNGKYVLVACRDDNKIEVYERNLRTGQLHLTKNSIILSRPVCIKFYPNQL